MSLSIAIPTYNRYPKLRRLLKSLAVQDCDICNILIIDASEEIQSLESFASKLPISHIKAIEPNLPLQRWQAIELCDTEFIGFLDDDVTLDFNYLSEITRFLTRSNDMVAGSTGWVEGIPKVVSTRRRKFRLSISGININKPGRLSKSGFGMPFLNRPNMPVEVDVLQGPSMFFKTSSVKQFGNLPWLSDLYRKGIGRGEDAALSGSLSKKGYQLFLLPHITVYHHTEGGGSAFAKKGFKKGVADSYGRYMLASNTSKDWKLWNKLAFFRYFVLNFIFFNPLIIKDIQYVHGLASGFRMLIKKH